MGQFHSKKPIVRSFLHKQSCPKYYTIYNKLLKEPHPISSQIEKLKEYSVHVPFEIQ